MKPVITVLMPMCGSGSRMYNLQNTIKPLYKLPSGEYLFEHALKSLNQYSIEHLICIVPSKYRGAFLEILNGHPEIASYEVMSPDNQPPEQVDTVDYGLANSTFIREEQPIVVLDCDIYAPLPAYEIRKTNERAHLFTFKHNNPNKSFIEPVSEDGKVVRRIVEKEMISDQAVMGAYMFKDEFTLNKAIKQGHKGYMSSVVMNVIENGRAVGYTEVEGVENYGTLEEYNEETKTESKPTVEALLFDLDGTLFDTEEFNWKAYQLAYFDLGIEIKREDFDRTKGHSVEDFNQILGVTADLDKLKELKTKYYVDLVRHARPNPYLLGLIKAKDKQYRTAIVTTARIVNILPLLKKYNLDKTVDVIVTQEDVLNHKPAPDAYNYALQRLMLQPNQCIAFEDSRPGFVAARAAGINCVKVDSNKFYKDRIKDMSGGSDAQTYLVFERNQLIVRKVAKGKALDRLWNQFKVLEKRKADDPIVKEIGFSLICGEYFHYDMEYIFAPSFYEYLNKTSLFEKVLDLVKDYAQMDTVPFINDQDLREEMLNLYIRPGYEIYKKFGGCECPVRNFDQIGHDVNNWRGSRYHGDATFENILCLRDGSLMFIDPVPDGNLVQGMVHDFSKIAQSLMNYEGIRDGKVEDFTFEKKKFNNYIKRYLTDWEYSSLKFHTACLFFRRLKHQVEQDPSLVKIYGDIGHKLLTEYLTQDYEWR